MKFPMISRSAALRIAAERITSSIQVDANGTDPARIDDLSEGLGSTVSWWGEEPELDTVVLEKARREIEALIDGHYPERLDPDQVEGRAACVLYRALEHAGQEAAVLDDPGFWRYVGLAHTWNFAVWREPSAFSPRESADGTREAKESFRPYVDAHIAPMCVPLRMYLRVSALGGLQHEPLASAVRGGTDFWRSHILRVKAGEHPPIVRAMVRRQADHETRLATDRLRRFAKDLNRTLTNLVPVLLDDNDADALVGELWQRSSLP